jgi:hypothetical protein
MKMEVGTGNRFGHVVVTVEIHATFQQVICVTDTQSRADATRQKDHTGTDF